MVVFFRKTPPNVKARDSTHGAREFYIAITDSSRLNTTTAITGRIRVGKVEILETAVSMGESSARMTLEPM